jgi:FixJ family two-component response regulator
VDDDENVSRSLSRVLMASGHRVRAFTRARDYLNACQTLDHSCVLVDIRMPEMDGIEMQRTAADLGISVPAVFMTATGDIPTVVEAMKLGATDLLAKPFDADTLLAAVGNAVNIGSSARQSDRELATLWRDVARLTPREAEVLAIVTLGLLNKQVAAIIQTTEKTVKVHRARVRQKLHNASIAEMVRCVDRLMAGRDHTFLTLDGVGIERPPTVDIIVQRRDALAARDALAPRSE